MSVSCAILLLAVTPSTNHLSIDTFDYSNTQAAAQVWTSDPSHSKLSLAREGGQGALAFQVPFASQPSIPRVSLDRKLKLDLAAVGEFALELKVEDTQAAGNVNLYFHSGHGWYAASGELVKPGWQTIRFSKAAFHIEESPVGWHQIDAVRISIWRGQSKDTQAAVRRLIATWHDVAIVIPSVRAGRTNSEHGAALQAAETVSGFLSELGLGSDAVEDAALSQDVLKNRRVAILAYHPRLDDQATTALEKFVQGGGKLLACYQLPPRLAQALGFGQMKYVGQKKPGQFAEIRFDAGDVAGLPKSVRQASWNITAAEPMDPNARVIGRWFDRDGKPAGLPALLLSDKGAFLTHILLPDDPSGKRQLLAAVLGRLDPSLWRQMAEAALQRAEKVGHCQTWKELTESIDKNTTATAAKRLAAAAQSLGKARVLVGRQSFPEGVEAAARAHDLAVEAYLYAQPSPVKEGRAFWNHSGMGAYPGDWERTARELSAAGFNMVMPNMLWGGLAHYASDVLPRSAAFVSTATRSPSAWPRARSTAWKYTSGR